MRIPIVAQFLMCTCLLSTDLESGPPVQSTQPARPKLGLAARMEVDEHEHCFTVQFFLKNDSERNVDVVYGRGDAGLEVVPLFHLSGRDLSITPPTYRNPVKRSLEPNLLSIPAGKEILYGTFSMGYPPQGKESTEELSATLHFQESTEILHAKPAQLKIPAQRTSTAGAIAAVDNFRKIPDRPGEWVNSDNGDLSLRLSLKSARLAAGESIVVTAAIRNNRSAPVSILRPFGDAYFAEAVQIKIWGEQGQIKYSGKTRDYDLTADAFVTLGPNEIVAESLELPVRHFAGTERAGTYTLRYDYAYDGGWDKKVASEGVKGIWHGSICSRENLLRKE